MPYRSRVFHPAGLPDDIISGVVVFLVALPLCLGIALASNAPLFSGVVAGIIGGLIVGSISKSHTSVSGPAAGLTAIVASQIAALGSFDAFLLALVFAGLLQIVTGAVKGGFIASFVPTCVIHGLLAAIGVILILKQIPHLLGHDTDPEGEMAFQQPDHETTFSELMHLSNELHAGAMLIGLVCLGILLVWENVPKLKKSLVPGPLVVVLAGVLLAKLMYLLGPDWTVTAGHLVQMPVAGDATEFLTFFKSPDFSLWTNPAIYTTGVTIALVASLETLLNLEAVDKLDPHGRTSPPSRELVAQGFGNLTSGLLGGLPVTSVIVRSSVNINAGARTKRSAIFHGGLLLLSASLLPTWINSIPLSSLAAILVVTGLKLAQPKLFASMWKLGLSQFLPFIWTLVAIVLTDLIVGILIGLAFSILFILHNNLRHPLQRAYEKHLGGEVLRIILPNHVSFLNRASLAAALDEVPRGGHVLIDASRTHDIDPDVLDLIREFNEVRGPARGVAVSLLGFAGKTQLSDQLRFTDHSSSEFQRAITPQEVLQILKDGHERFRAGERLMRNLKQEVDETAAGQFPLAVVLSCIDSRTPAEIIFDLGVGDIFNIRIAGNVVSNKVLGSMEYGCAVAGAKLILVMGHTSCGAVTAAVDFHRQHTSALAATGCEHLDSITTEISQVIDPHDKTCGEGPPDVREASINDVVRRNVLATVDSLPQRSPTLRRLLESGRVAVIGGIYDVGTGEMTFLHNIDQPQPNESAVAS